MADDRYNNNAAMLLVYAARGFASGLSDVTVTITKSDGTATLASTTMTEIGTTGVYNYSWTPSSLGNYIAIMTSASINVPTYYKFEVVGYEPGTPVVGYTTATMVKNMTNIDANDLSDTELNNLITYAIRQLNNDVNTLVVRERIDSIDNTRENDIDGVNTTFYVQNWKGKFIGDMNDDGSVTVSDVNVYQVASDGTETTLTVSTITPNEGKFVLSAAPASGVTLYVTYEWAMVSEYTPDPLVQLACTYLVASYAYAKINIGRAVSVSFGDTRFLRHMDSYNQYYRKYIEIVSQINSRMISYGEALIV